MKKVIFATFLLSVFTIPAYSADDISGIWLAGEGKTKVEIYKKDSNHYCGKIVWLEQTTNKQGEPLTDKNNPDRSLRDRPIMGLHMLENLEYKNGKWYGSIYTPKRGRTLDAVLMLENADKIIVQVSYRSISRKQVWTRTDISQ
jgi:uncharacterized protein (DUF2147 family)